ncbi:MAG: hypothetical protein HGA79_04255 [Anaerolineales bacterium]|nr:hypothetical protein [Anaerolineales bacterium]
MNKSNKMTIKLVALAQILTLTLAACAAAGVSANVCHATGDTANPYEEITINSAELVDEHRVHSNDIFPVPVGGCPASLVVIENGEITICHATSSETNPYEEITVSVNGLNGHGRHEGDIIPMPEGGCPAVLIVTDTDETAVCHATGDAANPYEEIMVPGAELNEYLLAHPNDINPAPSTGCPAYPIEINNGEITFCHANGSETNPYDEITVSVDGLDGHGGHEGDVFPVSEAEGCPASLPVSGKITICHATSSAKNPYNEITVSINGLNGHDKHDGDIIPAPAGGCPTTRQ